jgi:hypothetical protein
MKSTAVLSLLSSLPTFSHALVGISWSVSSAPSSGLTDITFPFNMANATHASGFYYAQQVAFNGVSNVGYTGLQPRADSGSNSVVHAVFSSFAAGTTTSDENCSDGADGGAGVSCSVDVDSAYADTCDLLVENTSGRTWSVTLVDTVSGTRTHIGSWTLTSGASGIKGSQVGFVEYYPWNSGTHMCDQLPYTQVRFGVPTTTTSGAGAGSLGNAYEYDDCVGKVDFKTSHTSSGLEVTVGF